MSISSVTNNYALVEKYRKCNNESVCVKRLIHATKERFVELQADSLYDNVFDANEKSDITQKLSMADQLLAIIDP